MPHTLGLTMKLSGWQHYNTIVNELFCFAHDKNLSCCYKEQQKKLGNILISGITFTKLSCHGITMFLNEYSSSRFAIYSWQIKINPACIYGIDRISIADEEDVKRSFDLLDFFLKNELNMPYKHTDFKIKRVDCSFNYFFESDDIAQLYMSLLKKGDLPQKYIYYDTYSQKSHRKITDDNSIYCWNKSESVVINIYIKTSQFQNDRYVSYDYDFAQSMGLIRFEIQCNRSKLESSKKKFHINSLNPDTFISDDFNSYILAHYLGNLFRSGDYYTYADAMNIIESSPFYYKSKDMMLVMLELTSTRNGLGNAKKEMLIRGYSKYDIKENLYRFDELGVNPVTIPAKYCIEGMLSARNLMLM